MDPSARIVAPGAVAIDGTDILAVGTVESIKVEYLAKETIDASGRIIIPGLVNTHTHSPTSLYRGLADDLALKELLEKYIFPAEQNTLSPEFVRIGTRLAALEMIQSGTTTFADMYYFVDEIAQETKAAGLRAVIGQTVIRFPIGDVKTPKEGLTRAEAFIKAWHKDPLITPAVAPHAIYTLDDSLLISSREMSKRYNVPTLIHLSETDSEVQGAQKEHGATPIALSLWMALFDRVKRERRRFYFLIVGRLHRRALGQ